MLWLAVGHSVSAVPLQCPFCQHHPFLSQVSQPPPLFLLPTNRLPRRVGMPLCILPPHLVRLPRPLCLLGSPLCCPALLPEKLFPRPLCLLGQPLCCPALLPEKLFPRPLCLLGLPLCGPVLPLRVPFLWPLCLVGVPLCTPPFLRSQFPFTVILRAHRPQHPVPGL